MTQDATPQDAPPDCQHLNVVYLEVLAHVEPLAVICTDCNACMTGDQA